VNKRKISCPYLELNPLQQAHSLIALPIELKYRRTYITIDACGSTVGWGTVLQAGRSLIQVLDEVDFFQFT
jgi:hypothetical protein